MKKLRIAVVGYGNIGQFAVQAVLQAEDMELAGVVLRHGKNEHEENGIKFVDDITKLGTVDVALLATPTRAVPELAKHYLSLGINTVDSYDIHTSIWDLRVELDKVAKEHNAVSIISAGWDPGSDSIVRTMLEACAPKGITYTNFGPGMSMGHTVAAKAIKGVAAALSMTIPVGTSIHRRMVYVQLENGADFEAVKNGILTDPYFTHDETHVIEVPDVSALLDRGHGVNMVRKGVSGSTDNQLFEFNMKINNPALTGQIMVAACRATKKQNPGAYTLIEVPVLNLLPGNLEDNIKRLV